MTTGRWSFGMSVRPIGSGTIWGICYIRRGVEPCMSAMFIKRWSSYSSFWGGDLGFIRGDVQKAIGGSRGFPTAYNKAKGGATEGQDMAADSSREGP